MNLLGVERNKNAMLKLTREGSLLRIRFKHRKELKTNSGVFSSLYKEALNVAIVKNYVDSSLN